MVVSIFCEMPPIALAQLVEAHRPLAELGDDQHRPFVADALQDVADGAAVLGLRAGASVSKKCLLARCRRSLLYSVGIQ